MRAEAAANPGAAPAKRAFDAFGGAGRTLAAPPAVDPSVAAAAADDPDLAAAIAASLSQMESEAKPKKAARDHVDETRRKRLARFG